MGQNVENITYNISLDEMYKNLMNNAFQKINLILVLSISFIILDLLLLNDNQRKKNRSITGYGQFDDSPTFCCCYRKISTFISDLCIQMLRYLICDAAAFPKSPQNRSYHIETAWNKQRQIIRREHPAQYTKSCLIPDLFRNSAAFQVPTL